MNMTVTEKADAKINLFLGVGKKREDGYHDLCTVMTSVTFGDTVTISKHDSLSLTSSRRLPEGDGNIAYRAMRLFFERTGLDGGARIELKKRIPIGAGLGGGSTDAAAVLRGLNRLYGYPMERETLLATALELGADVPFCVDGVTSLAGGVGEKLTPIPTAIKLNMVIAAGQEGASTAKMFALLDTLCDRPERSPDALVKALARGQLANVCEAMYNDFELCYSENVYFAYLKEQFAATGAVTSMLTGSGSAVFAIYDTAKTTARALETLRSKGIFCFRCTTY